MKKYVVMVISLVSTLVIFAFSVFVLPFIFIENYSIRESVPFIALFGPYILFGYSYWAQIIAQKRRLVKNLQWFFDKFVKFTQTPYNKPIPEQRFHSITHFFQIYEREFGRYIDFRLVSTENSDLQEIFLLDERYWIQYSIKDGLLIKKSDDGCQSYQKLADLNQMYKELATFCKTRFGIRVVHNFFET